MRRVPEPELMDDPQQVRAYAEADFAEPHNRFVELFRAHFPGEDGPLRVLDLGCGPADIGIRFAHAYPHCVIDAFDAAPAMLEQARLRIAAAGLQDRIHLHHVYLPRDPLPGREYDALISNSLLHHMAQAAPFWQCLRTAARPGSRVLVMDLLRPDSEAAARSLVDEYAAGEPEILRRDFYQSLLAAYRPDEIRRQLQVAGLEFLSLEVVSDRHWIVAGRFPA